MIFRIVHAMVAIPAFPHLLLLDATTRAPAVQGQNSILQDQYIQRFLFPVKYPTVEPAARKADKCLSSNAECREAFKAGISAATQP